MMHSKYKKYLDLSEPERPEFKATRISRYCVFTISILKAAKVASRLDRKIVNGKDIKLRGTVTVNGEKIDYTMVAADIEISDQEKENLIKNDIRRKTTHGRQRKTQ